jgi:hypothetical protein
VAYHRRVDFLDGAGAFFASFSADERAVSRAAFRALLAGAPVPPASLAAALGLDAGRAAAAVAVLVARGTMLLDADGAVVAARGLSLIETPHALALGARRFFTFCAVDAIGIPLALAEPATVASRCHRCRTPLALEVAGGGVRAPRGTVIWAADRDVDRPLRSHT